MKTARYSALALSLSLLSASALAADAQPAPAQPSAATTSPTIDDATLTKHVGYVLGNIIGRDIKGSTPDLVESDIDCDTFLRGLRDGLNNKVSDDIKQDEIERAMQTFQEKLMQRHQQTAQANLDAGKKFMEEFAKKDGVQKTKSGVLYRVITPGTDAKYDAEKHGENAEANLTYKGSLIDGTVFDESKSPVTLPVNQVVPGFSEVLKTMPIGAEWEVVIPSELAYGEQAPSVIGPCSTLIFNIKLENLQKGNDQAMPMQLTPEMLQQLQSQMPQDN